MNMQVTIRFPAGVVVCAAALALAACQLPGPIPAPDATEVVDRADRLAAAGRDADAAELYARAAERSEGAASSRLHLRAAELWWQAGDTASVRDALERLDPGPLDRTERARTLLLEAALALDEFQPAVALRRLEFPLEALPPGRRALALGIRAEARFALDMPKRAIEDLLAREPLLEDPDEIADNMQRIWLALSRVSDVVRGEDDPLLAGWLALADLRRLAIQDPWTFADALDDWRRRFPGHPATDTFVKRLVEEQRQVSGAIHRIALILPISGRFAGSAEAVRDGFLAAHFRMPDPDRRPEIHVYDTAGDLEAAVGMYHEAVREGADMVVGPLQREAVTALARSGPLPVPVLALNTVLGDVPAPGNMYRFGLSPEDEATQIAERLVQEGRLQGIALMPDNDFGMRMLHAFEDRYESLGGTLLVAQLFDPRQQDHSAAIVRALAIDESRARHRTLQTVLGADLKAEPRRRRDAEFVFLVGTPPQGRALRPQLRFHHAADLPVYASSHIYTGVPDRQMDGDLDGVTFTDMPWTVAPDAVARDVKSLLADTLGGGWERDARLYALGFDAYRLVPVLRHQPGMMSQPVPAATGALHLDDDGRVRRHLSWARFSGGLARPLQQ